jgi:hypothetical protein
MLGVIAVASLALAMAGCASDSSSSKKKSGSDSVSSGKATDMSGSIQNAMNSAMEGEGARTGLTGTPILPAQVMQQLNTLPRFHMLGGGRGQPGNALDTYTSTFTFAGTYPCSVSGTLDASGTLTDAAAIEDVTPPYTFEDQYSTTDPIALTLTACSDGVWTLDGDVTFDMGDYFYLVTSDLETGTFEYAYDESFDASVTGTEESSGSEVTADITYDLTGAATGSFDTSDTLTYDTFEWTFDITVNGDSFSCSWTDPEGDPSCT